MNDRRRGAILTVFAIGFALMAISNFMKPLSGGRAHFVFLGTPQTGVTNMILGPLFGAVLAVYAFGVWTMRKFALPISYFYAAYVILNTIHREKPRRYFAAALAVADLCRGRNRILVWRRADPDPAQGRARVVLCAFST